MAVTNKVNFQEATPPYLDQISISSASSVLHPIPWTRRPDEIGDTVIVGLTSFQMFQKRVLDISLAVIALVIFLFPIMLIAVAIRLESKGPIFYRQKRVGLGGRIFNIWKFRSMRTDAEEKSGAVWASASDSRRTKVGAFIRRTSLDELPQLLNVFMGEMSLVGPRPERPIFVNQFKMEIPQYLERHSVPVGVTGLAQIRGLRGNTCIIKRTESDLEYARNWSLLKDLKILFGTVFTGFVNKNAY